MFPGAGTGPVDRENARHTRSVATDVPPHQLAASMREVLEDADRRALLSREALEYARQMSFPNVAKRYLELLEL